MGCRTRARKLAEAARAGEDVVICARCETNRRSWCVPSVEADAREAAEPVDESTQGQGTVVEEMVTCGDETCAYMSDGEKHGPYLYRYYREGGTLTSEYLGKP